MPAVFREIPPLELVERFLMAYSLRGLNDSTWFTKKSCNLGLLEEVISELLPYYVPCKAEEFLYGSITYEVGFRALRHVIKGHGANIKYVEKSCRGKEMWYQISSVLVVNTEVSFD